MAEKRQTSVTFAVLAKTYENEQMCLIGKSKALGNWMPQNCIRLESCPSSLEDLTRWHTVIQLDAPIVVEYRYMICIFLESHASLDPSKNIIITRWETVLNPRKVAIPDVPEITLETDRFGCYDSSHLVSYGWLTGQTEIQLRFKPSCIKFLHPVNQQRPYRIRCLVKYCKNFQEEVSNINPQRMAYIVVSGFRIEVLQPESEDVTDDGTECKYEVVGHVWMFPFTSEDCSGTKEKNIVDNVAYSVGKMSIEYFIAKPHPDYKCDMSVSYSRYWNNRGSLHVGHRGMGSNHSHGSNASKKAENTLDSLATAAHHGADYVEFDVQLSRDLMPIVFHDFKANVSAKVFGDKPLYAIPIKDCTTSELWGMELHQFTKSSAIEFNPFPTLQECFETVERHVGFNIELKYAMQKGTGEYEVDHYFERNLCADVIIDHIMKYAGTRRIVISSFDPDICILLRLKQNKYPVLFLSFANSTKYQPFMDERTRTLNHALNLACAYELLGLSLETSLILKEPECVRRVQESALVLFCWGEDTNDESVTKVLRELGVNGIIHDSFSLRWIFRDTLSRADNWARRITGHYRKQ